MTQWGIDTLFNPAKRHMDEEKRRLQSTREELGDSSGGRRIDLESGKVIIARDDDIDSDDSEASGEGDTDSSAKPAADRPEPSAAAKRAAQRRGRTAR